VGTISTRGHCHGQVVVAGQVRHQRAAPVDQRALAGRLLRRQSTSTRAKKRNSSSRVAPPRSPSRPCDRREHRSPSSEGASSGVRAGLAPRTGGADVARPGTHRPRLVEAGEEKPLEPSAASLSRRDSRPPVLTIGPMPSRCRGRTPAACARRGPALRREGTFVHSRLIAAVETLHAHPLRHDRLRGRSSGAVTAECQRPLDPRGEIGRRRTGLRFWTTSVHRCCHRGSPLIARGRGQRGGRVGVVARDLQRPAGRGRRGERRCRSPIDSQAWSGYSNVRPPDLAMPQGLQETPGDDREAL
jgi:hypothetical protein